jgi:hypothetical protein
MGVKCTKMHKPSFKRHLQMTEIAVTDITVHAFLKLCKAQCYIFTLVTI